MTAQCREGHDSTELDYCSVCGAPMGGAPARVAPLGGGNACPACGEPRADATARYCEVCRYDFVARKAGPPPAGPVPAPAAVGAPRRSAAPGWEVVVTVDPLLDTDPDAATPCPKEEPERVFALEVAELLVGRRDDTRDIRPDIPLNDPGTSRRHAKIVRNADGSASLQDLASMNGTCLNGTSVPPGSRHPLQEGDTVTVGRWTRMQLRRRS